MWSEREHQLLMLSCLPGLGERGLARLLDSGIPLSQLGMLPTQELCARFGLSRRAAHSLTCGERELHHRVAVIERALRHYPVRVLTRGDADYPSRLNDDTEAPPLLFAYGNTSLLEEPTLAILASRGESQACLERGAVLASEAARSGMCLVAGHNRPIYRTILAAAKAVRGNRLIVLDRGLLEAFEGNLERDLFPTARLWGYRFDPERALVLSPHPPQAPFVGLQNQRRDHLVCLLATQIVALEIRAGGVMEKECRAARARGIPVSVWNAPGVPEGNAMLLQEGFAPLA